MAASKITWADKVTGDGFSAAEATQIKSVSNYNSDIIDKNTSALTFGFGTSNPKVRYITDSFGQDGYNVYKPVLYRLGFTDTNITNDVVPGSCLATGKETAEGDGVTRTSILQRVKSFLTTAANTPSQRVDLLLIAGGINDPYYSVPVGDSTSTDTSTYYGALKDLKNAILAYGYPTQVLFIGQTRRGGNIKGTQTNIGYAYQYPYAKADFDILPLGSISVVDNFNHSFDYAQGLVYTQEGVHPNASGAAILRRNIFTGVLFGSPLAVGNFTGGTVTPPSNTLTDNFNRTNNSTSLVGTGSLSWVAANGTWGILNNKAANFRDAASGNTEQDVALVDTTYANGTMQVTINFSSSFYFVRLYGRYSDSTHYIFMQINYNADIEFYSRNGGNNYTSFGTSPKPPLGSTHTYKIVFNGDSIQLLQDNVSIITGTSSVNNTATQFGIGVAKGGGADAGDTYFDDFSFTPA